jgi:NADPH:quinone reductase-like Zn-dependent oxidoreductase
VIRRSGGPRVLAVEPHEPAAPAPGEVAIEVAAAGVNFADLACRLGLYRAAPRPPFTPGLEVAGTVAAVGAGVERLAVGERVMAVTRFGGYATRLNVTAGFCRPLPASFSFEEGAAFLVAFLTAWHGLVQLGRLAAGERVVVQSAAGGVGLAACQIARALGARVLGTVGSADKCDAARGAGAEQVVVSPDYRIWPAVEAWSAGAGVDVVFDAVGGPGLRQGYRRLRAGGRLIVYGFAEMMPAGGLRNWPLLAWKLLRTPRFTPLDMTTTNRSVVGFNLIYLWQRTDLFDAALERLTAWVAEGRIRPVVGAVLPFDRAADAHRLLHSRRTTGKLVLRV